MEKLPEHMQILQCKDEEEVLDLIVFAYAEVQDYIGNKFSQYKLNKVRKKYRERFMETANEVCDTFFTIDPTLRLRNFEAIKMFLDYFRALHGNYQSRGLGSFRVPQMSTVFALEVFSEHCTLEFGSLKGYLEALVPKKKKRIVIIKKQKTYGQRTKMVEKNLKIKGLSELVF